MATEKIISTRILNKVDTLENWNKSTLPLRKGEIAIATVAATAGTGLTEPVCMIKIGEDGVKTFKELPWNVYAKASDVIAAAKSEDALTTFVNNVIAGAGIATDAALKTLTTRVGTAENDIDALEEKVGDKTVSAQITEAINALKAGDIKNAVDRIAALETDTHTHANKALLDTYTQTEVNLADAVAKKHSHANAAELDKFADGDKAKLDTAVQSITACTGLKATKTGTDVAVDIDDTVVFIFDCGDSTTV